MKRITLTDAQVEKEIERLSASDYVKLARREIRLKYKRRQQLYTLRSLEQRGKELAEEGYTVDNLDERIAEIDEEIQGE